MKMASKSGMLIEDRIAEAFVNMLEQSLNYFDDDMHLEYFLKMASSMVKYDTALFYGTKTYEEHMKKAEQNAWRRPFGIEMHTFSQNMQLVLYPQTVFQLSPERQEENRQEGYEAHKEGPQAMLYIFDGFVKENKDMAAFGANATFIGYMTDALVNGSYPLETGERSPEFLEQVKGALNAVKNYANSLSADEKSKLPINILNLVEYNDAQLNQEAHNIVLYRTEPIKARGLYESDRDDITKETPQEAVQSNVLYLHLDARAMPKRAGGKGKKDVPSLPWTEYGTNRWNRDHHLYGRYELRKGTNGLEALTVDYKLDSTHFPLNYGFFHTLEIAAAHEGMPSQHIILGQEAGELFIASPIIAAGDFDFSGEENRKYLTLLANDKGTKKEVANVLKDVLRLAEEEKLERESQTNQV